MGVRFIAITDGYDSSRQDASSHMLVSFKNLMNDNYCRDASIKIRSHLDSPSIQQQKAGGQIKVLLGHNRLMEALHPEPLFPWTLHYSLDLIIGRAAPGQETVYPLAGLLYCGDCLSTMARKSLEDHTDLAWTL